MEVFLIWLVLAVIPAMIAARKGYSGFAWFLYGALIWPIALVHALLIRPDLEEMERRAVESGEMMQCPHCMELIHPKARVCKHCGRDPRGPEKAEAAAKG